MAENNQQIRIEFKPDDILHPYQRNKSQTYLVNKIREAVYNWREGNYPNTTNTTKRLLEFWFKEDHIVDGKPFKFWFAQREAIETLIYVYEVLKKRTIIDLAKDFGEGALSRYDPAIDKYPLYCFKMATGSGKTFVMAFAIVWQYFNKKFEKLHDYTDTFVLIAPNVIVYQRLERDFKEKEIFRNIFRRWPFIPPEWFLEFNLDVVLRDDPVPKKEKEVLFLTNIQRLEERETKRKRKEREIEEIFELEPVNKTYIYKEERMREVLEKYPGICILKDEAHRIYNLEREWKKNLLRLHESLVAKHGEGFKMELEFTATPKDEKGRYFPWIISDFTLKEAVQMGIVKYPLKGILEHSEEFSSSKISERFRRWIDASIRRWQEYNSKLKPLGKKSVLFIQCPTNPDADDVYYYLKKNFPEIKENSILLIHTDSTGEITKKDLEKAREEARKIDEEGSEIEVIVSTMMLNEGWDVRSVNIILGLRPYTAKREILPEQVIGRGLRKMFPEENPVPEKCINTLEIIGPPGLLQVIEELEKEEGIKIGEVAIEKEPIPQFTIFIDQNKLDKDIKVPFLSPKYVRVELDLKPEDIEGMKSLNLLFENKVLEETIKYTAVDLKGIPIVKREWELPVPKDISSVISYYAQQIRTSLHIPKSFAEFYPLVETYVRRKLFNKELDLETKDEIEKLKIIYNLARPEIAEKLRSIFKDYFKNKLYQPIEIQSFHYKRVSEVIPFIWTKLTLPADKCIFNVCPCDNNLEVKFASFLEKASDVVKFTKNEGIGFFIEYIDYEGFLRNYKPDFIVVLDDKTHYLVETKGLEDINVVLKDQRAKEWCEDATRLTGINWKFYRLNQVLFERNIGKASSFRDLIKLMES
jgi:type III restriction enzyme